MYTGSGRRYKRGITHISFLIFVVLLSLACSAPAQAQDDPYLTEILESARRQKLHDDPYWNILVHYRPGTSGRESLIDDPNFFLAPDGKTDPEAELEATIRAFFKPHQDLNTSAACRFVARFEWIKDKLNLDPLLLPIPECPQFLDFMEKNKPKGATLVFPMAHLNSPASMFGHTLLTIETADKTKLLAYSVSYSAFAGDTFGPLFAVKGLFGLYPGYFSVLPYYAKLQQYSDVDHRDIWEYRLNLTEPEIRRMMLHIREMDSIASDYYFFNENCSYLLYFLLEAARPSLDLTDKFHGWLIPLDSIRMIGAEGLITDSSYRPSRTTKIKYLATGASAERQDIALRMAGGVIPGDPFSGLDTPDMEKRKTYELAGEYLQYLYTKRALPKEIYQERFLSILQTRSRLGTSPAGELYEIPAPVRPDLGHGSNRFAVGSGMKKGDVFVEMRIRPAYHHLMDNDTGFVEGAHLVFADVGARYYPEDNKLSLESLDIIDIFSLSPRDKFFHPISWKVKTGLTRITAQDGEDHLVYGLTPGGGFAFKSDELGLLYWMLETNLYAGGILEHNYAAGAGGSAGLIKQMSGPWKAHVFARDLYYVLGDTFNSFEACVQQSFTLSPDQSITLDLTRQKTRDFYQTETNLLWNVFF